MRIFTATVLMVVAACNSSAPKQKIIRGSIDVKPEMKANVQSTDTVFVIARKAAGGPPLAVKKLAAAQFPMPFELTEKDVMMGGPFEGDVDITVRIDKDGDAMTKNTGDMMGKTPGKIAVGDTNANIVVDQTLP